MEEILSSIRRIISEDGDTGLAPPEDDGPKAGANEASAVEPPPARLGADDDIFDLAGMDDDPPPEPTPPAPPPPAPTSPRAEDDGDVLELTDVIDDDDDDTVVQLRDEAPALETEPAPTPGTKPEPEAFEPEAIEVEPELSPLSIGDAAPTIAEFEGLVSAEAAAEASVSLTGLHHTVAATRGVPMGHPQRTLEDIVKELLRPMLKQWLDRNLSVIVERVVSREISKLVGRTEDEKR
jgi:hypothetical protein